MRFANVLAAAALFLFAWGASAQTAGAGFISAPGKALVAGEIKLDATVTAVDAKSRQLVVKLPDGQSRTIVVGAEVRNFGQIKVGDRVEATVMEALTLELKKGGAGVRERDDSVMAERAKAGEKPGAAVGTKTTVIADVTKVDRKAKTVTLKGVRDTLVLKVDDPEQLKLIEVGDQVKGTYIEAVGLAVVAKPAK